ncbi:UTP--glucose-1-phosphate uridylyltransferase, partial [Caligus rogercresseyi]
RDVLSEPSDKATIQSMLSKLVVIKLNGGLGTSMGCKGPKSVISVRNDLTFLDLTVQQIEYLNKTYDVIRYPRIHKESLMPIATDIRTEAFMEAWYPPGHGDFYQSFSNSGLLDKLIEDGKEFCFLSNIDNMGATVDLGILNLCLNENREFVMEVTDKNASRRQGLLEVAQVPKSHTEDFKSVKKFNVFNTNNL